MIPEEFQARAEAIEEAASAVREICDYPGHQIEEVCYAMRANLIRAFIAAAEWTASNPFYENSDADAYESNYEDKDD